MTPQAETIEEDELAEYQDDFEVVLAQLLLSALTTGLLVDAVQGLMALAAEGALPTDAVATVSEELGLPRPIRVH